MKIIYRNLDILNIRCTDKNNTNEQYKVTRIFNAYGLLMPTDVFI